MALLNKNNQKVKLADGLTEIGISQVKQEIGGGGSGTDVIANPELTGEEPELEGLQVGENKYKVPEGGTVYKIFGGIENITDDVLDKLKLNDIVIAGLGEQFPSANTIKVYTVTECQIDNNESMYPLHSLYLVSLGNTYGSVIRTSTARFWRNYNVEDQTYVWERMIPTVEYSFSGKLCMYIYNGNEENSYRLLAEVFSNPWDNEDYINYLNSNINTINSNFNLDIPSYESIYSIHQITEYLRTLDSNYNAIKIMFYVGIFDKVLGTSSSISVKICEFGETVSNMCSVPVIFDNKADMSSNIYSYDIKGIIYNNSQIETIDIFNSNNFENLRFNINPYIPMSNMYS